MRRLVPRLATILVAVLALAALPASAAGSEEKKDDTEPGHAAYNAGVALMKQGDYAEAQRKFEAALEEDDALAEAHNNLAFSLRKQGEAHYPRALEHYDRAIALDPELAEAYMYRGVLHALMGNEDKALADHATLVDLDRDLAEALKTVIASGEEPDGLEGLAKAW